MFGVCSLIDIFWIKTGGNWLKEGYICNIYTLCVSTNILPLTIGVKRNFFSKSFMVWFLLYRKFLRHLNKGRLNWQKRPNTELCGTHLGYRTEIGIKYRLSFFKSRLRRTILVRRYIIRELRSVIVLWTQTPSFTKYLHVCVC